MTDLETDRNRASSSSCSNNGGHITPDNAAASVPSTTATPAAAANSPSTPTTSSSSSSAASTVVVVPLNNTRKRTPDEYTKNFDLNEISPLRAPSPLENNGHHHNNDGSKGDLNARNGGSGGGSTASSSLLLPAPVVLNITSSKTKQHDDAPDVNDTFLPGSKRNNFKGTYDDIVGRLDLSERARRPFCVAVLLCAALLATVIGMAVFWPRVPAYLWSPVCVEEECMDASAQILRWANTSADDALCQQPYEWACGRFDQVHAEHPLNGLVGGEWTADSSAEYEELLEIHSFVAKLPQSVSSTAQLMLKRLHADCMKYDAVDKAQADFTLGKAIRSLSEWVYGKDWVPNAWDFRSAMITAHSRYGLSPFFKVSMRNRNAPPFGNIITVSEGRLGLPHQMFYNLRHDHRIIDAYKMLLRDFAINFGTVAEVANKFAEEMFYFEKRITNALPVHRKHVILTLGEVQKLAPMLPIFETITTTFSNTKLDDRTPVWIEDVGMLKEMSIIVSTTDVAPLNSFLVWSLARHFLPFMSADYRAALRHFDSVLYGNKSPPPVWYECAKLLHDWVPFAVDALRFNPELVVTQQTSAKLFDHAATINDEHLHSEPLRWHRLNNEHELARLLFAHLRHQMQRAVDDNVAIQPDVTAYINDRLATMELHVGLPRDVVDTTAYVNGYFADFLWRKMNFIDHLESRWAFAKRKMEDQMVPTNRSDRIVAALYPTIGEDGAAAGADGGPHKLVQYSIDLHAIVVAERAVNRPYFHHKYPIAVNFARLGAHISRSLLDAVHALGDQFEQRKRERTNITAAHVPFRLGEYACLESQLSIDADAKTRRLYRDGILSATFNAKAFVEFQRILAANRVLPAVAGESVAQAKPPPQQSLPTYDRLGLRAGHRQAGLRQFDAAQLFALATMQSHCGRSETPEYRHYKAFVEGAVAQREMFDRTWSQVGLLGRFLQCPAEKAKCESIL